MNDENGFLLPGVFDPVTQGDPASLHQAGLDLLQVFLDDTDVFPGDPDLDVETPEMRARETLPQWGPNYVAALHEKVSDVDAKIDKLSREAMRKWSFEPTTIVVIGTAVANGSGVVDTTTGGSNSAPLFVPPPGFTFAVHRFSVRASNPLQNGNNFGTPFNAAQAYWELRVDGDMIDGGSLVSGQGSLPFVKTWGTRDAPRVRDGEQLSLFMNAFGTFAFQPVFMRVQGTYDRTVEG